MAAPAHFDAFAYAKRVETAMRRATPPVFRQTVVQTLLTMGCSRLLWKLYQRFVLKRDLRTLTREEIAEQGQVWKSISPYVTGGYRETTHSFCFCLCSCGCGHNECCNIWSHFFAALYYYNSYRGHNPKYPSRTVALAGFCLFGTSTIAHSFGAYSKEVECFLFRCDRASIAAYFWAFSLVGGRQHFGSRGETRLLQIYNVYTSIVGAGAVTAVFFGDYLSKMSKVLTLTTASTCLMIPVVREFFLATGPGAAFKRGLVWKHLPLATFLGGLGGISFALYLPERFCSALGLPDDFFDYFHSHSLMHVIVFLAAYWGYTGQSRWDAINSVEL